MHRVDAADQSVAVQDREDVVAVLSFRNGDVDLDPVAEIPERLGAGTVVDQLVERRQQRGAIRHRAVVRVRVDVPLAALEPDAQPPPLELFEVTLRLRERDLARPAGIGPVVVLPVLRRDLRRIRGIERVPAPAAVRLWKTFRSKLNAIPLIAEYCSACHRNRCSPSDRNAVRNHNGMAFSFRPESRSPSTGFPTAEMKTRINQIEELLNRLPEVR